MSKTLEERAENYYNVFCIDGIMVDDCLFLQEMIQLIKDQQARIKELEAKLLNPSNSTGLEVTEAEIEAVARAICLADRVDPDKIGYGVGRAFPVLTSYPLWMARIEQAKSALEAAAKVRAE